MTSNYKRSLRRLLIKGLPSAKTVRIDIENGPYGKRVVACIKRTDDRVVYIARAYPPIEGPGACGVSADTLCRRIIEDYEGMNVA